MNKEAITAQIIDNIRANKYVCPVCGNNDLSVYEETTTGSVYIAGVKNHTYDESVKTRHSCNEDVADACGFSWSYDDGVLDVAILTKVLARENSRRYLEVFTQTQPAIGLEG